MKTYAIEAIGLHRVKIGRSEDVFARAFDLQAASPVELRVIAVAPFDIERRLHRQLGPHRIHGEWFALNRETRVVISTTMESEHMPTNNGSLSSRNPTTKSIAVRLPAHLVSAVEAACVDQGINASELLRAIIEQWAYGSNPLAGPDAGYERARAMAAQLAHSALRKALGSLPASHDEAVTTLEGYQGELAGARKRT